MTVREAAKALECGVSTVHALCSRRKLAHYRISVNGRGAIRIEQSDIDAFKAASRVEVEPPAPKTTAGRRRASAAATPGDWRAGLEALRRARKGGARARA